MKYILISLSLLFLLPACNKPKENKKANNAVTKYHKKQVDKVKKAEATVKNLNKDIKNKEKALNKFKNE